MLKLAKTVGCEEFYKEWSVAHSMLLNDKTMTGELILSIHPMDYLTMSEGSFSSCMNWQGGGCYRAGTVEMMNSPYAICVFFEQDKKLWGWNWMSKRWRTLILVDPKNFITSVKAYPFQHKDVTICAMNYLKTLAEDTFKVQFTKEFTSNEDGSFVDIYKPEGYESEITRDVGFTTNDCNMYCDFGTAEHYMYITPDFFTNYDHLAVPDCYDSFRMCYDICYSGPMVCMNCGEMMEYCGQEAMVCCEDCIDVYDNEDFTYCDRCGDRIYDEDVFWVKDSWGELCIPYCHCCYDNYQAERREERRRMAAAATAHRIQEPIQNSGMTWIVLPVP